MSEEEYHRLLERAITQLPPESIRKERFVIPNPISEVSGNRTILYNLKEISDRLKRDRTRILKFLAGEFATSGTIDGDRAIFQGKFNRSAFVQLIDRYVNEYVLCPVCNRPDTTIARKERVYFLVCEACGASSSVRGV
ncbi:MAG: translation initiation factor IF-2 subunit beta [Candidatus Bathyarchaeota archaeon]|nr:MAG: translation initiation factor IF-2 subunit beta [Candidatus Bathyarchaeota archaeon]